MPAPGEFDLIARIRARCPEREDVSLGIGDDAALLQPPMGELLAVTADTLNAGVHFPPATDPEAIGHKALAVNLSDLTAMGARPLWCTLSLCLPDPDEDWLDRFLDGFLALAQAHGIALVGGDTTQGPLSISVTAIGSVRDGQALRRDGARAGDDVWLTGTVGDAAAGLLLARNPDTLGQADDVAFLRGRLDRPTPRVAAGIALRGLASAAIDVSDGVLSDLGHVLEASGLGAEVSLGSVPTSPALAACVPAPGRHVLQLTGGDDYELCFTAAPEQRDQVAATFEALDLAVVRIGRCTEAGGLRVVDADGQPWQAPGTGYRHFQE